MKARQIQTTFWDDNFILEATWQSRFVYIYLLTCPSINLVGIFQIAEGKIIFETGISPEDFSIAKEELTSKKKALFCDGWVCIPNAFRHNRYWVSEKNWEAWETEFSRVSKKALSYFDTTMDTDIYRDQKLEIDKQKQKINERSPKDSNQKIESGKPEKKKREIVCTANDETALPRMMTSRETDQLVKEVEEIFG